MIERDKTYLYRRLTAAMRCIGAALNYHDERGRSRGIALSIIFLDLTILCRACSELQAML